MRTHLALCLAVLSLSGCASMVNGTSQDIAVSTDPPGGFCVLSIPKKKNILEYVVPETGVVTVHRGSEPMTVECGFKGDVGIAGTQTVKPKYNMTTAGNMLADGLIGLAIDASNGANYEYPKQITVPMVKAP